MRDYWTYKTSQTQRKKGRSQLHCLVNTESQLESQLGAWMLELTVEVPVLQLDPWPETSGVSRTLRGLRSACTDLIAEWGIMQVMLCCRNILERSLCNKKTEWNPNATQIQPGTKESSQKHLIATEQSLLPILEWIPLINTFVCMQLYDPSLFFGWILGSLLCFN